MPLSVARDLTLSCEAPIQPLPCFAGGKRIARLKNISGKNISRRRNTVALPREMSVGLPRNKKRLSKFRFSREFITLELVLLKG
jgi:hypothetical protein